MESKFKELFQFEGKVPFRESFPLALQHVIAMIAGCVAPALIFADAAGLSHADSIIIVQMALIGSALTSFLMLYPIGILGSKLPMIYGVSFAYVPTMIALCGQFESLGPAGIVAVVLGSQLIGAIVSVIFGLALKYITPFFPPLVSGTVVLAIGLTLYPVALTNMGGAGSVTAPGWGAWQYWLVGTITLLVNVGLNHFGKGITKLASVLFAMVVGYIIALFFDMVDISPVREAGWFSVAAPLHFGLKFDISAIISFVIIFMVTCIEGIGDMSSTTIGGMDRTPTSDELRGGIVGFGVANIVGSLIGCLPTATFSQNAGIVSVNKVINRKVFFQAGLIILIAGFMPKISSLLTTIPAPVVGGATLSVFAAITMNGIRMITEQPLTVRNTSIVGISIAIGFGFTTIVSTADAAGITFMPEALKNAIGVSPVVLAAISSIIMNLVIPETDADKKQETLLDEVLEK